VLEQARCGAEGDALDPVGLSEGVSGGGPAAGRHRLRRRHRRLAVGQIVSNALDGP
jgi:hypothetical protein